MPNKDTSSDLKVSPKIVGDPAELSTLTAIVAENGVENTVPPNSDPNVEATGDVGNDIVEPVSEEAEHDADEETENESSFYDFLKVPAVPAWLVSTLLHLVMLLALALITFSEPSRVVNVLTANVSTEDGLEIEEFVIDEIDPGELAESEQLDEPVEDVSESLQLVEPMEIEPLDFAAAEIPIADLASEMAPPMPKLQTLAAVSSASMSSRNVSMKKKMLLQYGGTKGSEAAVSDALKWFARHQLPDGNWSFVHNEVCNGGCNDPGPRQTSKDFNAATALAILPFMGAGQTQLSGEHRKVVNRGLNYLIKNGKWGKQQGKPLYDLRDTGGRMYSHGLAAIALCEAYAMTGDKRLLKPAQGAVNFIVQAQCSDGGWRYLPQDPRGGDTSVFGWQLMALKSADIGHLVVPGRTIMASKNFLDRVSVDNGVRYRYSEQQANSKNSMTAVGLLCRMYTGWNKNEPSLQKGVDVLAKIGVVKDDIYHDYYAAQVMRQYGGPKWDKFNVELRDWLVETQDTQKDAKGSWYMESDRHSIEKMSGRLGVTAFATMILEVYYRHMPLYGDAVLSDSFPL